MTPPIRVLAIVPEPSDVPWAAEAAAAWRSLEQALRVLIDSGRLEIVRLTPATANALDGLIQREPFSVIHVLTRGSSRPSARYGTLTMEAADRRARALNAQNFARACAQVRGLEVVLLHNAGGAPGDFDVLRDLLVEHAASVVCAPPDPGGADPRPGVEFARLFYAGLAAGLSVEDAFLQATANPAGLPDSACAAKLVTRTPSPGSPAAPPPAPVLPVRVATAASPAMGDPAPSHARQGAVDAELLRKRTAGAFDVFLCHNVGDKPAVMAVGRQLMACGVLPWLDQWELRPGIPWQRVLEEQIASIHAAAVFVGRDGIGPWQRQELDGFLREFNKRGCPVIPVMLPGAAGEPQLPLFLRGMTWVDFRVADPDPLAQLIWGITGKRPADI